jgi:hypothetical protein
MKPLNIPKGSVVVLGEPAKPMPQFQANAITEMVRGIVGIQEAYLPQCYVKEVMEAPAQVLVLVLANTANYQSVMDSIGQGLAHILPQGMNLDVWPMDDRHRLLSTVRGTQTHIHRLPPLRKRPWWRLFG